MRRLPHSLSSPPPPLHPTATKPRPTPRKPLPPAAKAGPLGRAHARRQSPRTSNRKSVHILVLARIPMETKESMLARPHARLPPGFRFRPTDEELVVHYLRRRALASPLPAAVDIPDVRLLAHDPSDLLPPGWSEQERYFFTCKEAKYVKGRRANRATGAGYWKATGKEKPVAVTVPVPRSGGSGGDCQAVVVGMKRSLVFYRGKPPSGKKTDWVMHEYRLAGAGLAPCRRAQGAAAAAARPAEGWVLCRVFRKKGAAAADPADRSDAGAQSPDTGVRFIDFFARADARRPRRAASPVSSSCVTDASAEHCRDQETTSRGA